MNAWKKLCLTVCLGLGATLAQAQINGNRLMPPPINMRQSGWDTTLQNGNLTFGLPLAQVPGEIPIPVAFGMNATYLASSWSTRVYDPDLGKSVPVINEIDRPMAGGVHFGYISAPSTYSGTTVQGLTVLESGVQIADSQWTAFSSNTTLGTVLNLPQAYGFSAVSTSAAMAISSAILLAGATAHAGGQPDEQQAASLRAALLPVIVLIGTVAPLALSTNPAVAEFGTVAPLLLAVVFIVNAVLVPVMGRWLRHYRLAREAPR